jgi:hypothetical protein
MCNTTPWWWLPGIAQHKTAAKKQRKELKTMVTKKVDTNAGIAERLDGIAYDDTSVTPRKDLDQSGGYLFPPLRKTPSPTR